MNDPKDEIPIDGLAERKRAAAFAEEVKAHADRSREIFVKYVNGIATDLESVALSARTRARQAKNFGGCEALAEEVRRIFYEALLRISFETLTEMGKNTDLDDRNAATAIEAAGKERK